MSDAVTVTSKVPFESTLNRSMEKLPPSVLMEGEMLPASVIASTLFPPRRS